MKSPFTWSDEATKKLLELWLGPSTDEDQEGNGHRTIKYHSAPFFEQIALKMKAAGCQVNGPQCQQKAKRLRQEYHKALNHNKKSGNNPSNFPWMKQMSVLGSRPAANPAVVVDTLSQCVDVAPRSTTIATDPAPSGNDRQV